MCILRNWLSFKHDVSLLLNKIGKMQPVFYSIILKKGKYSHFMDTSGLLILNACIVLKSKRNISFNYGI